MGYSSSICPIYSFEFEVHYLLYWLITMTRDSSLLCHVTHICRDKGWIHTFPKVICAKVNTTILSGIRTRRADFAIRGFHDCTTCTSLWKLRDKNRRTNKINILITYIYLFIFDGESFLHTCMFMYFEGDIIVGFLISICFNPYLIDAKLDGNVFCELNWCWRPTARSNPEAHSLFTGSFVSVNQREHRFPRSHCSDQMTEGLLRCACHLATHSRWIRWFKIADWGSLSDLSSAR